MTRFAAVALAALLVFGAVSAVATAAPGRPFGPTHGSEAPPQDQRRGSDASPGAQMDGGDNGSAPPGGFVSSVVGMEEAHVDATVTVARFETRLAAAPTDERRAAVVAATLNDTRTRVSMLEMRLETLEARRANDTITEGWFAVETSWLLSAAETQAAVLARLERAARALPADELARRNASVARIRRVTARTDRLLATDRPAIHRTTFDRGFYRRVAAFAARYNASDADGGAGAVDALLDGERVTLVVESGMRPPGVVSFRTTRDGRIVDLRAGEAPDETLRLRTDERTAARLLAAENPRRALSRAVLSGEVSVRGVGPVNRLKWRVRRSAIALSRALADLGEGVADAL